MNNIGPLKSLTAEDKKRSAAQVVEEILSGGTDSFWLACYSIL